MGIESLMRIHEFSFVYRASATKRTPRFPFFCHPLTCKRNSIMVRIIKSFLKCCIKRRIVKIHPVYFCTVQETPMHTRRLEDSREVLLGKLP